MSDPIDGFVPGFAGMLAAQWNRGPRVFPNALTSPMFTEREFMAALLGAAKDYAADPKSRVPPGRIYVVAHSFGCLAAVQAAFDYRESIDGLMLVAPADPDRFGLGAAIPERPLGVPAIVVASTNDPWMSFRNALKCPRTGAPSSSISARQGQSRPSCPRLPSGRWPPRRSTTSGCRTTA